MADHADLHEIARVFLADGRAFQNPRSVTGVRDSNHGLLHLKHAPASLAAEAAALKAAAEVGDVGAVRAVPLVAYDVELNVILTRQVDGVSVFNRIWNGTQFLRRRFESGDNPQDLVIRLAHWLSAFHDLGPDSSRDAFESCRDRVLRDYEARIRSIHDSGLALLPAGAREQLLRLGASALSEPGWDVLQITHIHGDFHFVNMLVSDDGTMHVLDFADAKQGFALEDVVRLWCATWEVARCSRYRSRVLSPAFSQVLLVNGLPEDVVHTAPFRLLRAWNALTRLNERVVVWKRIDWSSRRLQTRLRRHHRTFLRELGALA